MLNLSEPEKVKLLNYLKTNHRFESLQFEPVVKSGEQSDFLFTGKIDVSGSEIDVKFSLTETQMNSLIGNVEFLYNLQL